MKSKNRQKMSGGFRKESGNERYCSILTIVETLKRRNLGLIENLKKLFIGIPAIFSRGKGVGSVGRLNCYKRIRKNKKGIDNYRIFLYNKSRTVSAN